MIQELSTARYVRAVDARRTVVCKSWRMTSQTAATNRQQIAASGGPGEIVRQDRLLDIYSSGEGKTCLPAFVCLDPPSPHRAITKSPLPNHHMSGRLRGVWALIQSEMQVRFGSSLETWLGVARGCGCKNCQIGDDGCCGCGKEPKTSIPSVSPAVSLLGFEELLGTHTVD
jgi:hypothetical protein